MKVNGPLRSYFVSKGIINNSEGDNVWQLLTWLNCCKVRCNTALEAIYDNDILYKK